jgi:nucleoid DNA-binding protein
MTTNEIIKTLAARLKITQQEARRHWRNMFAAIATGLQKGETVAMQNFGALNAAPDKPLRTYDAATQEFVPLPTKIEFFFRPYKRLKERLKEWRPR